MKSHVHYTRYSRSQQSCTNDPIIIHLRIGKVPGAPALTGAVGTGTGRPPKVLTGPASGLTSIYGPSAYAKWGYGSSGALGSGGHSERSLMIVVRPYQPP